MTTSFRTRRDRLRRASVPPLAAAVAFTLATTLAPTLTPAATASPAGPSAAAEATDSATGGGACQPLFDGPVKVATAAKHRPAKFAQAAASAASSPVDVNDLTDDPSAWFDVCGKVFFVEATADPTKAAHAQDAEHAEAAARTQDAESTGQAGTAHGPVAAYSNTFSLNSLPSSNHTIYLDFDGGTVTGTGWNRTYGSTINVTPYDNDGQVSTSFSNAELDVIQNTWAAVAADYAAFDVNVTTQWPGQDAITRNDASDTTYGSHVMITNGSGNPIYDSCGCAGVAYIDVFDAVYNHAYYQPAWVFADGTGHSGKGIGEGASHEVGHNFGLDHDGGNGNSYYDGAPPWAPIMGAGYYEPVSQWSRGEYAGANNTEDDVAIIAAAAPQRFDDHGAGKNATRISPGTPLGGIIATRSDVDEFTFTAAGATTIDVDVAKFSNLDVQLTVTDSTGATLATLNPQVTRSNAATAAGLDASWSGTAPAAGETYTFSVDGVGNTGSGMRYSDYGSLGSYTVSVTTSDPGTPGTDPVTVSTTDPAALTSQQYFDNVFPVQVTGGRPPYSIGMANLPQGVRFDSATGELSGTPTQVGTATIQVAVYDADDEYAAGTFNLTVNEPTPAAPVAVDDQTFTGTSGEPFTAQLVAASGENLKWSSSNAPSWVSLTSAGVLSGTPTSAGTGSFTVTATDAATSDTATVTLTVAEAKIAPLEVKRQRKTGFIGQELSKKLVATGGDGTYTWEVIGGQMAPGLDITTEGHLHGTPTTDGTFKPRVRVTSGEGTNQVSATARVVITIKPEFTYATRPWLPKAKRNQWFKTAIKTSGAHDAVRWSKVGGGLPKGMRFKTREDRIVILGRGKYPTKRKVTFHGVDKAGREIERTFVVRVVR